MPVYRGDTRSQFKEVTNDVLRHPYKNNKMKYLTSKISVQKLSVPVQRGTSGGVHSGSYPNNIHVPVYRGYIYGCVSISVCQSIEATHCVH